MTTETEFPANLTPWLALFRSGVSVRRVPTRDGAFTAGDVAALCDEWMLGPEACGILFTRSELREQLHPPGGWTNLPGTRHGDFRVPQVPEYVSDGTRFEVGALPTPGVFALAASLELLLSIGIETVAARNGACLAALIDELPRSGWEPVLFGGRPRSAILAARPPEGVTAHAAARLLGERGFVVSAR